MLAQPDRIEPGRFRALALMDRVLEVAARLQRAQSDLHLPSPAAARPTAPAGLLGARPPPATAGAASARGRSPGAARSGKRRPPWPDPRRWTPLPRTARTTGLSSAVRPGYGRPDRGSSAPTARADSLRRLAPTPFPAGSRTRQRGQWPVGPARRGTLVRLTIAEPDAYRRRLVPWEEADELKIGRRNAEERRL